MIRKENIVLVLEVTSLLVYFAILIVGIAFTIEEKAVMIAAATWCVIAIIGRLLRVKWI